MLQGVSSPSVHVPSGHEVEDMDVQVFARPLFLVSRMVGTMPATVVGSSEFRFSSRAFGYAVCLLVAIVSLALWGLSTDLENFTGRATTVRMKTVTSVVVTFCDICSVMATAVVAVIFSAVKFDDIFTLLRQIKDIDFVLYTKFRVCDYKIRRDSKWHVQFLLFASEGYLLAMALYDVMVWSSKAGYVPYIYFPVYGLYLVVGAFEFQFVHFSWHLQKRFHQFNIFLLPSAKGISTSTVVDFTSGSSTLSRVMSAARTLCLRKKKVAVSRKSTGLKHNCNRVLTKLDLPMSDDWDRHNSRLSYLCQLHGDLCEAVHTINRAYGIQVLVYTLTIFLHLIISPYFFLLNLLYPKTYGKRDPAFLVLQALWIIIHISKLFLIVHPWKAIGDQAVKTGALVSNLLNVELHLGIRKQLKTFALQLVHRKMEFSACGFCHLDYSLIASMTLAVTTYLVILIQFQNSDTT